MPKKTNAKNIKKKNNKKTKINMKKNNDNKTKVVITLLTSVVAILSIIMILIFNGTKKLNCTKKVNNNGILMNSEITFNTKGKKINDIIVNKIISIDKGSDKINYLSAIKTSLEENYKKEGIKYSIKLENNELIVNLKYNEEKEYILDNLFIDFEENGISINFVSEDSENNYAKINLKKEYEYKNIRKILEKSDYVCK